MAAVTADRVIVELEAKLDRYEANVRRAEQKFDRATRNISNDAKRMEREISRNADAVGARFRALAGTFAAAFSAQQVKELADGYTRFTNQLQVAGLEGERLADVQGRLFDSAQKYGVQLESLGTLYSRGAQVSKELGASNAELLQFTNGVAAALKIQGTSATEAQGALLQLSQALGSGTVRAEEFNSINEGALPILKAVASNLDAAGGSVAKLKTLVNDGQVSSEAFFRAFLAGSAELEAQAAKASLTIGNSFTVLNNALGVYIGQADDSLSATERLSSAIISLSENLDTVATALGVIGAILLGRFAAGMVAAGASTGLASTALFALQARAVGAATTMEALALTSATAGRALLAAFGGPVGIAVTALTLGVYYLATRTDEAAQASAEYAAEQERLKQVQEKVRDATDTLAVATGQAREQAIANAEALRKETQEYLANARAALAAARAKAREAAIEGQRRVLQATRSTAGAGSGYDPALGAIRRKNAAVEQANADVAAARQAVEGYEAEIKRLEEIINAPAPRVRPAGGGTTTKPKPTRSTGPKPTDPEEIARRFEDDLARGEIELRQALADAVGTAEARREVEKERIRVEQEATARSIKADKDLSETQKGRLLALNDQIAAARQAAIEAEKEREAIAAAAALRQDDLRNQQDVLRLQSDLADTAKKRREIELRILDLQYEEERIRLQAIIDNKQLAEAEREAARRRLASVNEQYGLDRERTERNNESPFERYRRKLNRSQEQVQEDAEQWMVEELEGIQDRLRKAITSKLGIDDPILGGIIDLFIEQVIMKPLADAFAGAASSQGGFFGALIQGIGSVFAGGRASGGHVSAGRMYRVNESGVEGFQPAGSGKIIPLGRMRGAQGGGVVIHQTVKVDASGSVNPTGYAEHIKQAVRQETMAIVGEGMKRVNAGVPARLAQYQRDGN